MAEPGARMAAAAGGHGRLRVSHAEREQVIDLLKSAFVQERLAKDELVARVGQALASQTYADLAAVTADIPARPAELPPPRKPARARNRVSMNSAVTGGACMVIAAHLGMLLALIIGSAALVILVCVFIVIGAAVAIVAMVVAP